MPISINGVGSDLVLLIHFLPLPERNGKNMSHKKKSEFNEEQDRRLKIRTLAAECAEHARLSDDSEPCDDGRAGVAFGRRKDDKQFSTEEKKQSS
jgi:hypothetical protein